MADVQSIEEHEDGTATLHLDLTDEEVKMLIQWGIKEAIKLAYQKAQNFDWKDSGSETNT
jgi:hypothetical protein